MSREITTLYLPQFYTLSCVPSVAAVRARILSWSCLVQLQRSPIFIFSLISVTVHASSKLKTYRFCSSDCSLFFHYFLWGFSPDRIKSCIFSAPTDLGPFVTISFLLSLVGSSLTFLSFFHSARADYFFQEAEIQLFRPLVPLLVNYLAPRKSCCNSLTPLGKKPFLSLVTFPVSTLFIYSRKSAFLKLCWYPVEEVLGLFAFCISVQCLSSSMKCLHLACQICHSFSISALLPLFTCKSFNRPIFQKTEL